MRLAPFLKKYKEEIATEWVKYARENIGVTLKMDVNEIRDHVIDMLDRMADDMDTSQTNAQQQAKSTGHKPPVLVHDMPAKEHGSQRVEAGFDIVELSSEFRALRASVLRLWEAKMTTAIDKDKFQDMIRFNEAIDEAWMHSMARFHTKVDESKNWFMGVLGHDLRSPLSTIHGAQQVLARSVNLSDREKNLVKHSESSVKHMEELINNLLELTKLRLGSGMTIKKTTTDLTLLCEQTIQEFMITYPQALLYLQSPGPVRGEWDNLRIHQVITNLIANALRHGKPGGPVTVSISAEAKNVCLSVHNEGRPIPESMRKIIFTGMYTNSGGNQIKQSNYGLGLFIVKEIVNSHNGSIDLESTEKKGTRFTITLPRN